jgi:hypothetical protein
MTDTLTIMPGGGISRRPLRFFILAGCSGSMKTDGRMQALSFAIASQRIQPARRASHNRTGTTIV